MAEKSENYQASIHDSGYEAEYLTKMIEGSSLINLPGGSRKVESLNGQWNFGVDLYNTCLRSKWYQDSPYSDTGDPKPVDWDWEAWDRITVPASWNLERKELLYYEGSGVYTRTFRYVPDTTEERLFLRFEGAAYRTSLFLNGEFIGTHDGASTPFNVDITGTVKTENRLIAVVDARRSPFRVPMDNTDWFNYGGIYRDVYLIRTPKIFIKDWFVRLVPDGSFSGIKADVFIANGDPADSNTAVGITGNVLIEIPELGIKEEAPVQNGTMSITITVKPAALSLWSPDSPKLYDVRISYTAHSDAVGNDQVQDRIGFREIQVRGQEIFLNGKKMYLNGVSIHEDHHELGKTTNEDIIRASIRDLKEMNGNYFRLAHYPHDPRFARIADEEGVLLWEEVPVYWAIAFADPHTYRDAENQLTELVLRDRNRASVIIWSVGNENADTDDRLTFMSNLTKQARALDDSRLISAACLINHAKLKIEDRLLEFLDIIGINEYYGWYDPEFENLPRLLANSNPDKPVLICEFGGGARSGQRGTTADLFTEDHQKLLYEKQAAIFKTCPYIAGTTPWIFYDFRCPRRLNRYQEGFNRKGLIDADRKTRKPAFFVMQEFYGNR
ncbi:beta-glucuronidase [Spirochaetia bacterium]|nr:beta-glucuronidase [Spirochaetia bacterium]